MFSNFIPCTTPQSLADAHAQVSYSKAANIGESKTWTQIEFCSWQNSVRGKSPWKCVHIVPCSPWDGQTSCKVWLASVERRRCSNEGKMRNPLKFVGVPQTRQQISAVSGPKFTILWRHVEEILPFNTFSDCLYMPKLRRYSPTYSCAMVHWWRFFA